MLGPLNGFGVAIGCMDIIGAIFFELMIVCMLRQGKADESTPAAERQKGTPELRRRRAILHGNGLSPFMLWSYLFLLNVWIVVSLLMVAGIIWHKPQLLLPWLIWCVGGLIFDVVFLVLWFMELITGEAIEALTNILISLLTMAIEFGFIFVIFNIHKDFNLPRKGLTGKSDYFPGFLDSLF